MLTKLENMKTFLEKTSDFKTSSSFKFYVPTVFSPQVILIFSIPTNFSQLSVCVDGSHEARE